MAINLVGGDPYIKQLRNKVEELNNEIRVEGKILENC